MAARRGNRQWCKQQLQKVLGWDADATEAVVEALAVAGGDQAAVDGLVESYMGGNAAARQVVRQFCGPPPSGSGGGGAAAGGSTGSTAGGGRGARAAPAAVEMAPPAEVLKAHPVLDMGRNIRTTIKPARKKGGGGGSGGSGSSGSADPGSAANKRLERPVVNCLRCGKIYNCRSVSDEALRFLSSGGICSFCGNRVLLRYADGTTNGADASATSAPGAGATSAGTGTGAADLAGFKPEAQQANEAGAVAYNDSAAAAVALKDRLVEYDRQSAKRTTVLDDQSDFFEIDANAWLTDEERAVLKQREREIQEAEEARRRRVTVTFDLLGRKVILDADAAGASSAGEGAGTGGGPGSAAASDAAALEAKLEAARAAAAATAAEAAQGGGTAAATALAAVEEKLRDLRITVNPSMAARHFVFLPSQQHQQTAAVAPQQQHQAQRQQPGGASTAGSAGGAAADTPGATAAQAGGGRVADNAGGGGRGQRQPQQRLHASSGFSRLQHDDPFDMAAEAEVEVLGTDEAGRRALEAAAALAAAAAQQTRAAA